MIGRLRDVDRSVLGVRDQDRRLDRHLLVLDERCERVEVPRCLVDARYAPTRTSVCVSDIASSPPCRSLMPGLPVPYQEAGSASARLALPCGRALADPRVPSRRHGLRLAAVPARGRGVQSGQSPMSDGHDIGWCRVTPLDRSMRSGRADDASRMQPRWIPARPPSAPRRR